MVKLFSEAGAVNINVTVTVWSCEQQQCSVTHAALFVCSYRRSGQLALSHLVLHGPAADLHLRADMTCGSAAPPPSPIEPYCRTSCQQQRLAQLAQQHYSRTLREDRQWHRTMIQLLYNVLSHSDYELICSSNCIILVHTYPGCSVVSPTNEWVQGSHQIPSVVHGVWITSIRLAKDFLFLSPLLNFRSSLICRGQTEPCESDQGAYSVVGEIEFSEMKKICRRTFEAFTLLCSCSLAQDKPNSVFALLLQTRVSTRKMII